MNIMNIKNILSLIANKSKYENEKTTSVIHKLFTKPNFFQWDVFIYLIYDLLFKREQIQ